MEKIVTSNLKLGIIAGGQLAKMLIQEASKWDIITYVLDNDKNCPASRIASHYINGSNHSFDSVYQFGKMVDVLTYEMEDINIDALQKLKSEGCNIFPDPDILELIQDKGLQKEYYLKMGLPSSPFKIYTSEESILHAIKEGKITFPFVQKLRKGGYDGRGVAVINNQSDLHKILPGSSIIEKKIDITKEIAVIVARNQKGEIKNFPVVEMLFDQHAHLVDKLICPAFITDEQSEKAIDYARKIIDALDMQGLLAVEFFIDIQGEVLINEVAPRPHNSGHHTIESIVTSQFEQHLRAILNLPLGSTQQKLPSVMVNILGESGHEGAVLYEGLTESLGIDGVKIHLYGKKITKPNRKMGHVTILSSTIEDAISKSEKVKQFIKVKSWKIKE